MKFLLSPSALLVAISLVYIAPLRAAEPADPDLIPEGRAVLAYLESIYGKKTLAGANGVLKGEEIERLCGKAPAIVTLDLSGWNTPTWGKTYTPVVVKSIESARVAWARGYLLTMQFHWKHPGKVDGKIGRASCRERV